MSPTIAQSLLKLIKNLVLLVVLVACQFRPNGTDSYSSIRNVQLALPSGQLVDVKLAITEAEQSQGLSGVRPNQLKDHQGMLFFYLKDGTRRFWMPDTYMDLDIFFLDRNLKVLALERNVAHHPGRGEPPRIPTTKRYYCRHVLELKAASGIAKAIKAGDQLKLVSKISLSEIESKIRHER